MSTHYLLLGTEPSDKWTIPDDANPDEVLGEVRRAMRDGDLAELDVEVSGHAATLLVNGAVLEAAAVYEKPPGTMHTF